jgi:RNA polymerase sigma-70 factor (ECF subfamily)
MTAEQARVIDLAELMRSYRALVVRALERAGVAERDVPDLVQEVFIVAHRRLPHWEGRAKLSTWFYRVTFRIASDHRRRAYQRRERLPGADNMPLTAATSELPEIERREQILQLCAALEQLSEEHKQALLGYELAELSVPELAERARVPHKTVYSRLYAARKQLRQLLIAQGWAVLGCVMWLPRRCLAAFRASWLVHAPLAVVLMMLTPPTPAQTVTPAPVSGPRPEAHRPPPARPTLVPPPLAAPATHTKRTPRRRLAQAVTAPTGTAPAPGLKVIHMGSVERPEGDLPFGFERIPDRIVYTR